MEQYTYILSYKTPKFKGTINLSTQEPIKSMEEAEKLGEILMISCGLSEVTITGYVFSKKEFI